MSKDHPPDAVKSGSIFSLENPHSPDYPVFIYHQTFLKDKTDGPRITTRALAQAAFHGESFERQGQYLCGPDLLRHRGKLKAKRKSAEAF